MTLYFNKNGSSCSKDKKAFSITAGINGISLVQFNGEQQYMLANISKGEVESFNKRFTPHLELDDKEFAQARERLSLYQEISKEELTEATCWLWAYGQLLDQRKADGYPQGDIV